MKEIGGYFGLEQFRGKEYHHDLIAVNSARNALLYILKARKIRKIYIPRFLCDTVREMCIREGFLYEEYSIDGNFLPVFDCDLTDDEYVYIVNFYGQISNDQIAEMKLRWKNIIIDNVQAFFQRPVDGVDTVYSCRKFFGVPDGGYVATDAVLSDDIETDISKDRMKHILGRFEETASAYYADFQSNDERFYNLELKRMSLLTANILRGIDYESVRKARNDNFMLLDDKLSGLNGLQFKAPDGPYCYPFYCKDGMALRKALAAEKIYVATLWPNVLDDGNAMEKDFVQNILPLPCDQRYNFEDMLRIVHLICQHISV